MLKQDNLNLIPFYPQFVSVLVFKNNKVEKNKFTHDSTCSHDIVCRVESYQGIKADLNISGYCASIVSHSEGN